METGEVTAMFGLLRDFLVGLTTLAALAAFGVFLHRWFGVPIPASVILSIATPIVCVLVGSAMREHGWRRW